MKDINHLAGSPQVYDILVSSALRWPTHPAIIDSRGNLDYLTLHDQVTAIRQRLLSLGIQPGCAVGIMARNARTFVISAFAAVGCGATVFPIPHQINKIEFRELLETAHLCAVLHDGNAAQISSGSNEKVVVHEGDDIILSWLANPPEPVFANIIRDAAFVRYTSGTTGRCRGVILSHRDILERTEAANRGLRLGPGETVVWVLPMAFHFFVSIILYIRYGATIAICDDHFAATLLDVANQHKGTMLYASPYHYRLLAAETSRRKFTSLRHAISTSIGLPIEIAKAFHRRYGLPVAQAYGVIEVGLPMINLDSAVDRPEAVGRPLPDFEVLMLDDKFQPVGNGKAGQLAVRGPGMFSAYLNPFLRRKDVLRNGWFLTGDIAKQDDDGLVTILGRCKSVINVAGNKVFPEEVESILNLHPQVESSRVSGRAHAQMGEVVHADVVLRTPGSPLQPEELMAFCRLRLSGYRLPSSIAFVSEINKTATGKIYRQ